MSRTARKPASKWDVPPRRGEYDHLLADIRDEVARMTPPPPPMPPVDPPRPPRVRIEIEIVHRQPPKRAGYRLGTATMGLIIIIAVLIALAGCTAAHAQPSSWQSHSEGFMTRYQGTDPDGGQWMGTSYRSGFTSYFDAAGPHGESRRCRSWQQGWQSFTECD